MIQKKNFVFMTFFAVCFFLIPLREVLAEENFWNFPPLPTIEELTKGKVKVGDTVTKDNVDLVKELLPASTYELVKQGLILDIGKVSTPGEFIPSLYRKATEESYKAFGRPIVNEDGILYTKDGKPWPGGRPFPKPQNVMEIMANVKYGEFVDDDDVDAKQMMVDKKGYCYKTFDVMIQYFFCNTRETVSPLGAVPGKENIYRKMLISMKSPRDIRGLGQLNVRYWDDVENPDTGFVYVPALKRTIRVSATTWQDSMGGTDQTTGDADGLTEPYSYWNFKLIATKPMLTSAPMKKNIRIPGTRDIDWSQFHGGEGGQRFHRDTWEVDNFYVVEATPRIKHIYSKKTLYVQPNTVLFGISAVDAYDLQGELWKGYVISRHPIHPKGHPDQLVKGMDLAAWYDLQTGHQTIAYGEHYINIGLKASDLSMEKLIVMGR